MAAYTDDEKATAVALAIKMGGLTAAGKELGIPKQSIGNWMTPEDRSEMAGRSQAKTREATEAHVRAMAVKRIDVQREFLDSALWCAKQIRQAEDGKDAHGYAMAGGTSLDKFRLEMGEATALTAMIEAPDRTPEQEAELDRTLHLVRDQAA